MLHVIIEVIYRGFIENMLSVYQRWRWQFINESIMEGVGLIQTCHSDKGRA